MRSSSRLLIQNFGPIFETCQMIPVSTSAACKILLEQKLSPKNGWSERSFILVFIWFQALFKGDTRLFTGWTIFLASGLFQRLTCSSLILPFTGFAILCLPLLTVRERLFSLFLPDPVTRRTTVPDSARWQAMESLHNFAWTFWSESFGLESLDLESVLLSQFDGNFRKECWQSHAR